jgi:hypothetical protein
MHKIEAIGLSNVVSHPARCAAYQTGCHTDCPVPWSPGVRSFPFAVSRTPVPLPRLATSPQQRAAPQFERHHIKLSACAQRGWSKVLRESGHGDDFLAHGMRIKPSLIGSLTGFDSRAPE